MIRRIKKFVPAPAKLLAKSVVDTAETITGRRDALTPPRRKSFVGSGDFKKTGEEFLRIFVEIGNLKPDERVLDVGCGIGRMAVPLTGYLKDGEYEGFDIVPEGIDWCRENITPRYPNFRFYLADIYNKEYNPEGKIGASEYRFPYQDDSFDFAFLTSVFTHMFPHDMENYLSETARVLKRDGRCLITFFLLNQESLSLMSTRQSILNFRHQREGYRTTDEGTPEAAIAYDERDVRDLYRKHGLRVVEPVHYGSWCGRADSLTLQDVILATKGP